MKWSDIFLSYLLETKQEAYHIGNFQRVCAHVREWSKMLLGLFGGDLGLICITPPPRKKKAWIHQWAAQENFSDDYTTRYQPCLTELTFFEDTGTNVFLWGNQSPSTFQQPCFTLQKYEKKFMDMCFFITALPFNRRQRLQGSDPSFLGQWRRNSL